MIISFYLHGGQDHYGRTFDDMLAMSDDELEKSHDVVQYLFPLNEASRHHRGAPILTAEELVALATPAGQAQYRRAYNRFIAFFGMRGGYDTLASYYIEPDWSDLIDGPDNFTPKAKIWLSPRNHNLKRITRIIRCAMLLKMPVLAAKTRDGFTALRTLLPMQFAIDDTVAKFWSDAVSLPFDQELNVRPGLK